MHDTQAELARLRELIETDPDAMAAAGFGDHKAAAARLARYAASKGIPLTQEDVETAFQAVTPPDQAEPLDDKALESVAGGTYPFCMVSTFHPACVFTH
jgi:hypothetical protein